MNIALIGTATGYGHISVINAVEEQMSNRGINTIIHKSFPEEMIESNYFLCDFYNYLLANSMALANKYVDFLIVSRNDKNEKYIELAEKYIVDYINDNEIDLIFSVAPFANFAIASAIKKCNRKVILTTFVTDPFVPYMIGYDCPYFDYIFTATEEVKSDLISKGVDEEKIDVIGFPIKEKFFREHTEADIHMKKESLGINREKVILCNAGSFGNLEFLKYLQFFIKNDVDAEVIFLCGKNKLLYKNASNFVKQKKCNYIKVLDFIDNMEDYLEVTDIVITKPGANAVFEALYCEKVIIIDAIEELMYQERGIEEFLRKNNVGIINKDMNEFEKIIKYALLPENMSAFSKELKKFKRINPVKVLVDKIISISSLNSEIK